MTHLDLFSGIGGFAIAAQNCGYQTVGFCEKEPYAQQILKEQFGAVLADAGCTRQSAWRIRGRKETTGKIQHHRTPSISPALHDDIFTLDGFDYAGVDLLTGGFPCQPFSVAGKRKGAADDRAIWPEMLRVIDGAKPRWIIGENVAGIVTMELDNILSDLEGIGYAAWPLVIPACAVDARHRRDRVWIVAHAARELQHGRGESRDGRGQHSDGGEAMADAGSGGCEGQGKSINAVRPTSAENGKATKPFDGGRPAHWLPEPELGRVAHGIPHRAHRLRGLGNAIVPQVAEMIIAAIPKTQ